jgi:hypothetical protein
VKNNASHSPHSRVAKNPLQCFIIFLHDDFMLTSRHLHGKYIKIQGNSHAKYDAKGKCTMAKLWPFHGNYIKFLKAIFYVPKCAQKENIWFSNPPFTYHHAQYSFDGHYRYEHLVFTT